MSQMKTCENCGQKTGTICDRCDRATCGHCRETHDGGTVIPEAYDENDFPLYQIEPCKHANCTHCPICCAAGHVHYGTQASGYVVPGEKALPKDETQ